MIGLAKNSMSAPITIDRVKTLTNTVKNGFQAVLGAKGGQLIGDDGFPV